MVFVCFCVRHSPWEIVDPYSVLVNHNASRHHPNENFCVTLVLKEEKGVCFLFFSESVLTEQV